MEWALSSQPDQANAVAEETSLWEMDSAAGSGAPREASLETTKSLDERRRGGGISSSVEMPQRGRRREMARDGGAFPCHFKALNVDANYLQRSRRGRGQQSDPFS
jgi:hypothetical protein